ncbi:PRC-barrel domain-containing protein [Billgrantia kenyensis]|uniref:PRC-barrel domain-containing protein n=1 Tax=Billgrantia kenyensis TaxID=321266 RepID=A0A7V9W398_9GAMM|nr:PRC-barrel domain-containing protein [Halomonas kenyensis]MBA2780271.1 PRC-barrel domain-containing protein [Halomonas kenyensis]MCG6663187.1 hypothetical protein [Halomonas kenyensis]
MKRTLLAIAIGAISAGLAGGTLAQENDIELDDNGNLGEEQAAEPQNAQDENAQDDNDAETEVTVDEEELPEEGDDAEDYEELYDDAPAEAADDEEASGDDDVNDTGETNGDETVTDQDGDLELDVTDDETQADPGDQATSAQPAAGQAADDTGFEEVGPADAELDDSIASLLVSEVEGMTIVNAEGETLGQVENVLRHEDAGDLHAVVSVGGFWIFGGSEVTLPLADMQLEGEQLVLQDFIGQDELDDLATDYDEERYSEVDGDMILVEAMERP